MSPLNHHHRSLSTDVFPLLNFHTESSKFMFTAQVTVNNNIPYKVKPILIQRLIETTIVFSAGVMLPKGTMKYVNVFKGSINPGNQIN